MSTPRAESLFGSLEDLQRSIALALGKATKNACWKSDFGNGSISFAVPCLPVLSGLPK